MSPASVGRSPQGGEREAGSVHEDAVREAQTPDLEIPPNEIDDAGARVRSALNKIDVHREAQEYEHRDPDYTPNETERALLEDFGCGLMTRVEEALRKAPTPADDGARLRTALGTARRQLVLLNGDPRDEPDGDLVQAAVLSEIDRALAYAPPASGARGMEP